jgi:predicted DNA-binding transcriptional regulator YafY
MSSNTFLRRLEIYEHLLPSSSNEYSGVGKTYQQLVEELSCDCFSKGASPKAKRKAVESDLKELMLARPAIVRTKVDKDYRFYIKVDKKPIFNKSADSALLKLMVNEHLYGLIPHSIWQTLQAEMVNYQSDLRGNQAIAHWNQKIYSASFGFEPKVRPELFDQHIFATLLSIIFEEKRCQIKYQAVNKPIEVFTNLNPIGLYRRGSTFYIIAFKDDSDPRTEMPRQFAVHRIKECLTLKDCIKLKFKSVKPDQLEKKGFYLDVFQNRGDSHENVEIKLTSDIAYVQHLFGEWQFSDNDTVLTGEEVGVIFKAPLTRQLTYWVRSFGGDMKMSVRKRLRWQQVR